MRIAAHVPRRPRVALVARRPDVDRPPCLEGLPVDLAAQGRRRPRRGRRACAPPIPASRRRRVGPAAARAPRRGGRLAARARRRESWRRTWPRAPRGTSRRPSGPARRRRRRRRPRARSRSSCRRRRRCRWSTATTSSRASDRASATSAATTRDGARAPALAIPSLQQQHAQVVARVSPGQRDGGTDGADQIARAVGLDAGEEGVDVVRRRGTRRAETAGHGPARQVASRRRRRDRGGPSAAAMVTQPDATRAAIARRTWPGPRRPRRPDLALAPRSAAAGAAAGPA